LASQWHNITVSEKTSTRRNEMPSVGDWREHLRRGCPEHGTPQNNPSTCEWDNRRVVFTRY